MNDGSRFTDQPGWETMSFVQEMQNRDPRLKAITVGDGHVWLGDETVSAPDLVCATTGYQVSKYVMDKTGMDIHEMTNPVCMQNRRGF